VSAESRTLDQQEFERLVPPVRLGTYRHTVTPDEVDRYLRLASTRPPSAASPDAAFAPHLLLVNDWFRLFRQVYTDGYVLPVSAEYDFLGPLPVGKELVATGQIREKQYRGKYPAIVCETTIARVDTDELVMRSVDTCILWPHGDGHL
jgi:hypothetical protein